MTTPTMKEIITEMSNYVRNSGFSVEWNESEPWVAIHDEEENDDTFFLEYEEAEQFIKEGHQKAEEADVHEVVGMLAQAKQYIDCI